MKNFNVTIEIMPLDSVLDPQGEALELVAKRSKTYKAKDFASDQDVRWCPGSLVPSLSENDVGLEWGPLQSAPLGAPCTFILRTPFPW